MSSILPRFFRQLGHHPTKAKGIEAADFVLCKFAMFLPLPQVHRQLAKCRVQRIPPRNIAVAVFLLERFQILDALFPCSFKCRSNGRLPYP